MLSHVRIPNVVSKFQMEWKIPFVAKNCPKLAKSGILPISVMFGAKEVEWYSIKILKPDWEFVDH